MMLFMERRKSVHILALNEPFDQSVKAWPEGTMFNVDASGHWLIYFYSSPSQIEIQSIQQGGAQFGLFMTDSVIFLLHQFGEMPWNDSSYSVWLVAEEERRLPEISDHLHALLRVVMVDTDTGLVAALRALTFSAEFTKALHKAIHVQASVPWDKARHEEIIRDVYARFTTNDMVRQSRIFCRGGE
jgi:hypothetical protein